MNAICLVIDRLHPGYVGAYGNTWIETPTMDRLASEAFLADQFLIGSPYLPNLYRSYWHGEDPLEQQGPADARSALPELLSASGMSAVLISDEPAVTGHPSARGFGDVLPITPPEFPQPADQIDQTHLAHCFARTIDWLDSAGEPFFLWCHFAGLGGQWDAPLEFRRRYAEEDDPDPPDSADVPCLMLPKDYDPDDLLGICQTYAGQVSLLDVCLGALLEFLDGHRAGHNTLLMLVSARGFPLGEHLRVGPYDDALYGELVHAPLVLRFPDRQAAAARSQALVHPADIWATLLDCCGLTDLPPAPGTRGVAASLLPLVREKVRTVRDRLCLTGGDDQWAVRTPAWYLRQPPARGDHLDPRAGAPAVPAAELFAKPDDRWEVNDVADRCPDVVDLLRTAFADYERSLGSGNPNQLPPLDEILLTGLD